MQLPAWVRTRRSVGSELAMLAARLELRWRLGGLRAHCGSRGATLPPMAGEREPFEEASEPMYPERREALAAALAIANHDDSHATVWAYSVTHCLLVLRIERSGIEPVTLTVGACTRIETPTRWRSVSLHLDTVEGGAGKYCLVDDAARFRCECGVVLVGEPS
jgi:hypothetical protein